MEIEATIGLEVHVQLQTKTKLFCGCKNAFGSAPNTLSCPICSGLPGTLPVLNREALVLGIRAALALECEIAEYTKFDRKNYFYPDLPKGYQISQFDLPYSRKGKIVLSNGKTIRIHRIHLEEDAGKGIHDRGDFSLMDYNRAGVPLLECVSEPDLHNAEDAVEYLNTLKQTMQYVGASECDMEKGSLRCDVNVSVAPKGSTKLGTKVEVKNLNSFRHVGKALEYEIARQEAALAHGEKIIQETRLWKEAESITFPMRSKEEAHDYRYFPDPDLPPFTISKEFIEEVRKSLPELPTTRRDRMMQQYSLSLDDAVLLTAEKTFADYYEEWAKKTNSSKANWWLATFLEIRNERKLDMEQAAKSLPVTTLSTITQAADSGQINVKTAKEIIKEVSSKGIDPADLIKNNAQVSDTGELEKLCREAMAALPKAVAEFKGGKENALNSIVGKVMGATKGRANPKIVQDTLRRLLAEAK